jgi:hypothetical protein
MWLVIAQSWLTCGKNKEVIHNLARDELLNNMNMPIMNGVECAAVKPNAQGLLLIEAKNDVKKECKYSKGDKTECVRRNW